MIIAIDGPAGTGKSTVAKIVAERLGYSYFDTGAMYRSLTYMLMVKEIDYHDALAVQHLLESFHFDVRQVQGEKRYYANEMDVTAAIRAQEVTALVSQVSVFPYVREKLVSIQRKFGQKGKAVFEGRDIGTVVFPNAELKIFLTASQEVRAQRRYLELLAKNPEIQKSSSLKQIQKEMEERDARDSTRHVSPLTVAPDAHLIDTSSMNIEEVVESIIALVKRIEATNLR